MSDDEIAKSASGAVMIPVTAGSVVLAYNFPGVKNLRLSRDAVVGIFLGKITKWNDPALVQCNPGTALPPTPINVAFRSDGSGTTYVFTQHLAAISSEFDEQVGCDKSVAFPVGIGGKGNEGVTALVKQAPGTIGYVEFGYAGQNGLPCASVENKSGEFIRRTHAAKRRSRSCLGRVDGESARIAARSRLARSLPDHHLHMALASQKV